MTAVRTDSAADRRKRNTGRNSKSRGHGVCQAGKGCMTAAGREGRRLRRAAAGDVHSARRVSPNGITG